MAAAYNLELEQLDVKTAYLNGTLEETIYMPPPPKASAHHLMKSGYSDVHSMG